MNLKTPRRPWLLLQLNLLEQIFSLVLQLHQQQPLPRHQSRLSLGKRNFNLQMRFEKKKPLMMSRKWLSERFHAQDMELGENSEDPSAFVHPTTAATLPPAPNAFSVAYNPYKKTAPPVQPVPVAYNGYAIDAESLDYWFFNVLGNTRDKKAHAILNQVCIIVALNLKKKSGRNNTKGHPFQPNSMEQFFRGTFNRLKKKGIMFDFDKDFNEAGQFHGVVKEWWAEYRKIDPKFGTNSEKKRTNEDIYGLVCKVVRDGVISIKDRQHVFEGVHFNDGLFMCFRGKQDHAATRKDNLRSRVYEASDQLEDDSEEDLPGIPWRGFFIPFNKTEQLEFGNTSLPPEPDRIKTMHALISKRI
ncbi:unknown protein [Seminavis robusta]|uniref:Uncharacterized protein n=1 Tax=Seminavis robusta TaxID=568900 RepID=A0A9N8EMI2_9STRA|nr:unknown protein [Seminavis robusta]|eukprot:Sro1179_g249560.1 n/a (358) ;mRNA; f:3135-4433